MLQEKELIALLRSFPSTMEVRYIIDEALTQFEAKRLPAALSIICNNCMSHCYANSDDGTAETSKPVISASQRADGDVDVTGIRNIIRSQVSREVARVLPSLVRNEVRHQMDAYHLLCEACQTDTQTALTNGMSTARGCYSSATQSSHKDSTSAAVSAMTHTSSSVTCGKSSDSSETIEPGRVTPSASVQASRGLPWPPPLPHVQPSVFSSLPISSSSSSAVAVTTDNALSTASAGGCMIDGSAKLHEDSGRRQREMILYAVRDVEHQVNSLQRRVNEIAHQNRVGRRRLASLCATLEQGLCVEGAPMHLRFLAPQPTATTTTTITTPYCTQEARDIDSGIKEESNISIARKGNSNYSSSTDILKDHRWTDTESARPAVNTTRSEHGMISSGCCEKSSGTGAALNRVGRATARTLHGESESGQYPRTSNFVSRGNCYSDDSSYYASDGNNNDGIVKYNDNNYSSNSSIDATTCVAGSVSPSPERGATTFGPFYTNLMSALDDKSESAVRAMMHGALVSLLHVAPPPHRAMQSCESTLCSAASELADAAMTSLTQRIAETRRKSNSNDSDDIPDGHCGNMNSTSNNRSISSSMCTLKRSSVHADYNVVDNVDNSNNSSNEANVSAARVVRNRHTPGRVSVPPRLLLHSAFRDQDATCVYGEEGTKKTNESEYVDHLDVWQKSATAATTTTTSSTRLPQSSPLHPAQLLSSEENIKSPSVRMESMNGYDGNNRSGSNNKGIVSIHNNDKHHSSSSSHDNTVSNNNYSDAHEGYNDMRTQSESPTTPSNEQSARRSHASAPIVGTLEKSIRSDSRTNAASRQRQSLSVQDQSFSLGIDAHDVSAGALPRSLGLRGGVCVRAVSPGQLGQRSGVLAGDVILCINAQPVANCAQLRARLDDMAKRVFAQTSACASSVLAARNTSSAITSDSPTNGLTCGIGASSTTNSNKEDEAVVLQVYRQISDALVELRLLFP